MSPSLSETSAPKEEKVSVTDEYFDLAAIGQRIAHGTYQVMGFALLGTTIGALFFLVTTFSRPISTSTRVIFAFNGFAEGEYPDHSKFQPDDLRAPNIIAEALHRQGLSPDNDLQGAVRGALAIEGMVPIEVIRERDHLRAIGQIPPRYIPDEYSVILTLPRKFPISNDQRQRLLHEIVSIFQENFVRTYANPPLAFGNVFETLRNADFFEYELILNEEMQNIDTYLRQQLDRSKSFRSQTTNLSFADLISQTKLFSQIQLNETLGRINQNGLSRDRHTAIVKMDYYLQNLADSEAGAIQEEKVVTDLLDQAQSHDQSYVLGIKTQAAQPRSETPVLDKGLIDSLLANDTYNMLVRQALEAGMRVKQIQADRARLLERRKAMEEFNRGDVGNQAAIIEQVQGSLVNLEASYQHLIANIRSTNADFVRQEFSDAVSLSDEVKSQGQVVPLLISSAIGFILGFFGGTALSLLGIYVGRRKIAPSAT